MEERIEALEARLMYQERALDDMSDMVVAQARQIAGLERKLAALIARAQEAEAGGEVPVTRPPHW